MKVINFGINLIIALTILTGSMTRAHAANALEDVNLPVTNIKYFATGIGPMMAAPAWGDLQKGPHSTFVKLPGGYQGEVHTHTNDYYSVVITGVVVNKLPNGKEVPLPPGSYWYQKGGEQHITNCISANECVFFVTQSNKFDYAPDKKDAK